MTRPTILMGSTLVEAVIAEYKRLLDLAPEPIGWVVSVNEGEPMTDEELDLCITFTPEDELTDAQRESIRAFFAELGNRGLVVYGGIPVVPIEIVEKPL
jgi:hypothetical protein